jgi:hypothetical protein
VIRIALIVVMVAVLIDAYLPLALASNCRLIKTSTLGRRRAYGTYRPPPV